jgi:hypothetical protein
MVRRAIQVIVLCIMLASSQGCLLIGIVIIKRIHDAKQTGEKGTTVDMQVQSGSDGVRPEGELPGDGEQQTPLQP